MELTSELVVSLQESLLRTLASIVMSPAGFSCPLWFFSFFGASLSLLAPCLWVFPEWDLSHCSSDWARPLWVVTSLLMAWDTYDTCFFNAELHLHPRLQTCPLTFWISIPDCIPPPQRGSDSRTCSASHVSCPSTAIQWPSLDLELVDGASFSLTHTPVTSWSSSFVTSISWISDCPGFFIPVQGLNVSHLDSCTGLSELLDLQY